MKTYQWKNSKCMLGCPNPALCNSDITAKRTISPDYYGIGFHNPSRDRLSYNGHFVDVCGSNEVFTTYTTCFNALTGGAPTPEICVPGVGCYCPGYLLEVEDEDPVAAIFYHAVFKGIAEDGECVGMIAKSLDFYYWYSTYDYRYADNTYGYVSEDEYDSSAEKPKDLAHSGKFKRSIENMHGTQTIAEVINYLLTDAADEPEEVLDEIK